MTFPGLKAEIKITIDGETRYYTEKDIINIFFTDKEISNLELKK